MIPGLGPPWILCTDQGKPVTILPAGRPGEVADVSALTIEQAQAIVSAANSRELGFYERLHEVSERVLALTEARKTKSRKGKGGKRGR